jgi:alpha-tubulin suppressor-like RCC1 family protein
MTSKVTRLLGLALVGLFAVAGLLPPQVLAGDDWTQWRHDECRSGVSTEVLPASLYLQWRRDLPTRPSEYVDADADYCRPVQLGKTLFVPVFASDRLTAYNTDTGAELWRYYASGALRRPPVAMALGGDTNVVIFSSDDGYVYCLNAADGSERWKFRGAPNAKKAMGFGRLGSVWPVLASPVAYAGKVYFIAGAMPTMCLYGYCLDAATGAVVWRNDGRWSTYVGVLSANGPLAFAGDQSSHAAIREKQETNGPIPFVGNHSRISVKGIAMAGLWKFSPLTGEVDPREWNNDGPSMYGARSSAYSYWCNLGDAVSITDPITITAGGKAYSAASVTALGVAGTPVSILAGDGKLFVTTVEGRLYCFGGTSVTPTIYTNQVTPLSPVADAWTTAAQTMLSRADLKQGLALVWGVGSGRLAEELVKQAPQLMIVAADPDPAKLLALRLKMDAAGIPADRFATVLGNPPDCGFAPFQAALIASEDATGLMGSGQALAEKLYTCTRPFGGEIWLATSSAEHAALAGWVAAANLTLCDVTQWAGFSGMGEDGFTQIRRLGLPDDKLDMKPSFGMIAFQKGNNIWYGSPARGIGGGKDIYTGRPMTAAMTGYEPPKPSINGGAVGMSVWNLGPSGPMMNTLYSRVETFPAPSCGSPACPPVVRYGETLVSPGRTLGFYDTVSYWGSMVCMDGSGCGGTALRALRGNGVTSYAAADYCSCYPGLRNTAFTLVSTEDDENWIYYRATPSALSFASTPIRRIGVNFGAVGDRYVPEESMLWTHHPFNGWRDIGVWARSAVTFEAPPLVHVTYRGTWKAVYHHSAQMEKTSPRYRGWVSASQVTGMDGMTIPLVTDMGVTLPIKPYTVRLYFAEMEDQGAGARVFSVKLQGSTVLTNLDVAAEAGGPRRELVKEFRVGISKALDIDFVRTAGEPMLSGVELMADPEPELYQPYAQSLSMAVAGRTRIALVATDPDGAALTYQIVGNPVNGTLSGTGPARYYTPVPGFSGTDRFTYRVVNASGTPSGLATVTITVLGSGSATISPSGGVLLPGQTYDFTFSDSSGAAQYPGADVTWTVSGGGTIAPVAGKSYVVRLTAGATAGGPYVLTATYAGTLATAEFCVSVRAAGTAVSGSGNNGSGQLGDGTVISRILPVESQMSAALNLAAGSYYGNGHSLAVKTDGTVWAWGYNGYGQLGDNTTVNKTTPVQVGLSGVTNVAAGAFHSLAVKTDGTVWAWGYNYYGQLGNNTTVQKNAPVKVLGGLSDVTAVAAGQYHSLAVKTDGTVWAWGYNYYGALGDNTTVAKSTPVQVSGLSNVTAVAAGDSHSLAVKRDGTVWAWGYNGQGQLGNNSTAQKIVPVQVSGLSDVTAVAAGLYHSLAVKRDGTVWAWGYNGYGQLGNNTTASTSTPVQVQGLGTATLIAAGGYHSLFFGARRESIATLTVNGGSGSGSYPPTTWVPISANAPPADQWFDKWTGDTAGIANVNAAVTTFKMPPANAAITATYKAPSGQSFSLTVNNGSGSGSYTAGRPIAISANAPPAGQMFGRWVGDTAGIADVCAATTTLVMPATHATIRANYVIIANQPPTATPQSVSVVLSTAKAITLTGSDPEGSNLTYKVKEGGVK